MIQVRNSSPFTTDELEQLRAQLLALKASFVHNVETMGEIVGHDRNGSAALSSHPADAGSDVAERDLTLNRISSESGTVHEIDEALQRLREGVYGLCEGCGKPIARARLEAIPYARLCMPCKVAEESM